MGVGREGLAEGGPGMRADRSRRAAPPVTPAAPLPSPAGYVLALALARSLPVPAALPVLALLRSAEPCPRQVREARAALEGAGLLLPSGNLTAEGREAAREALGTVLP